jgi:hypothetical protein
MTPERDCTLLRIHSLFLYCTAVLCTKILNNTRMQVHLCNCVYTIIAGSHFLNCIAIQMQIIHRAHIDRPQQQCNNTNIAVFFFLAICNSYKDIEIMVLFGFSTSVFTKVFFCTNRSLYES